MAEPKENDPVLVQRHGETMSIILNRPRLLNSLDYGMVRMIRQALEGAMGDPLVHRVFFYGQGEKGFCAGGDVRSMAQLVRKGAIDQCLRFLEEEYRVDLMIHRFPKPVVVLADGITMGGGLGISAGADIVLATERTKMAMPETRIGFFPDVGATGWMFRKCPPGYPEYLGLTGYEMTGPECVRVGLATHWIASRDIPEVRRILEGRLPTFSRERAGAAGDLISLMAPLLQKHVPPRPSMDDWVRNSFAGRSDILLLLHDLRQCGVSSGLCEGVFQGISERSPTVLALTIRMLRHNEGRPMEDVFRADLKAARFILSHPDFLEGVRARLLDKDDQPKWNPHDLEDVGDIDLHL